jgi:Flp pilus assembly protein TadB
MDAELAPVSLATAGFAAIAAALAVSSPPAQQRAADGVQSRSSGMARARWRRVADVLAGRPDAIPLARRGVVVATAVSAIAVGLWRAAPNLTPVAMIGLPLFALAVITWLGWLEPGPSRSRRQQLLIEAPQALELLASGLTAGLPLRAATETVAGLFPGPLANDLGSVLRMIDLGLSETDAWRTLRGHPQLGAAASDLARSAHSGTMVVDALNHHAGVARQRRHAALQVAARAVGVRSVLPMMTCFLPAFLLLGVVPSVVSAIANALS